jgi:hypothetical protein
MKKMRIHEINLEFGEQVTLQIMRTSKDDIKTIMSLAFSPSQLMILEAYLVCRRNILFDSRL